MYGILNDFNAALMNKQVHNILFLNDFILADDDARRIQQGSFKNGDCADLPDDRMALYKLHAIGIPG